MGRIIDVHTHIGRWQGIKFEVEQLDTLMLSPLSNGDTVDKMIVSSLSCIAQEEHHDELIGNKKMLEAVESKPNLLPLAVCQPRTGSVDKIRQLFNENPGKFVGLKFHPDVHELIASDVKHEPYLKFAQEEGLPCLFHCGIGWDNGRLVEKSRRYSSADAIYQTAKKSPYTPVILAHLGSGGPVVHRKTISVLLESLKKSDAKLYADISWVDWETKEKPTIVGLIKDLKERHALDRLLFGTDAPIGEFETLKNEWKVLYSNLVTDIKNAIKNDRDLAFDADNTIYRIFFRNAEELFLGC